jgi:hypothetical protein
VCILAVKKKSGQVSTCRIGPFPCEFSITSLHYYAECDVYRVCIPFRHVFLTPVFFVRILLTPTCHVRVSVTSNNDGHMDLIINCLFYSCCYTSLATQNHCYNETRNRLTTRSRSLLTASSLLGSSSSLIACLSWLILLIQLLVSSLLG